MQKELIILAILIGFALGIKLIFSDKFEGFSAKKKSLYKYKKKEFFMTRSEHECIE